MCLVIEGEPAVNGEKISLNRAALAQAAAFTLLFVFAAHAFCFFNLTLSSQSVMINAGQGISGQIAGGRYLQAIYWRLRGELSAPLLVGLLSALYLALGTVLAAWLLRLEKPAALFALCGAMTVNAAVLSVFAGSLHTADAGLLSMLLGMAAAACCLRVRLGIFPGAVFFAAAAGLGETGPACGVALAAVALARDLITGESGRRTGLRAAQLLGALAAGAALYDAGYRVMLARYGMGQEAALKSMAGGGLAGAWLYPIRYLFEPLTAYPHLNVLLRVLLMALGLLALLKIMRRMTPARGMILLVIVLVMPFLTNLPVYARSGIGQTSLAFCFLDVFLIALLDVCPQEGPGPRIAHRMAAGAFGVLFLGGVIFSNQVYLKKNLEFQSTLSVMTRVLDRAEQAEGYRPGETPVAIVGTLEDSSLSVPHKGFEHLAALDAAQDNYAVTSEEDVTWYMWDVLGYPCNLVSSFELSELEEREEVKSMPAYPAEGCCQWVEDTLVIKLSQGGDGR